MKWQILKISFWHAAGNSQYIMSPAVFSFTCVYRFSQLSFTNWSYLNFRLWECLLFQHSSRGFLTVCQTDRCQSVSPWSMGISVGRSEMLSCVSFLWFGLSVDQLWVANMAWHVFRGSKLDDRDIFWITPVEGNET